MPIFNTERDKLLISGDKHTIGYNHTNTPQHEKWPQHALSAREMAATCSIQHKKWPEHALLKENLCYV